jgi:hypothetical protein
MKLVIQTNYMFLSCINFKLAKRHTTSKRIYKNVHSNRKLIRNAKRICLFHNIIEVSLHPKKTQTSPQQSFEEVRTDRLPLK